MKKKVYTCHLFAMLWSPLVSAQPSALSLSYVNICKRFESSKCPFSSQNPGCSTLSQSTKFLCQNSWCSETWDIGGKGVAGSSKSDISLFVDSVFSSKTSTLAAFFFFFCSSFSFSFFFCDSVSLWVIFHFPTHPFCLSSLFFCSGNCSHGIIMLSVPYFSKPAYSVIRVFKLFGDCSSFWLLWSVDVNCFGVWQLILVSDNWLVHKNNKVRFHSIYFFFFKQEALKHASRRSCPHQCPIIDWKTKEKAKKERRKKSVR